MTLHEQTAAPAAARLPDPVPPLWQGRAAGSTAHLDAVELEAFMLNVDASLHVCARHQFFAWTQGALQRLITHELLICATRSGDAESFHVDSLSTAAIEAARFNELVRHDMSLVPHLIHAWEENHRNSVAFEGGAGLPAAGTVARELARIGASDLIAHGTYATSGQLESFFIFACRSGALTARQRYLVELVVPFLHAAWVRMQVSRPAESTVAKPAAGRVLTVREKEILEWIYHGKSNIEIGMILQISPLTVKNHVQKILRKLSVLNRAQAVGKALTLRILNT
jgi:transcriptional regulator EpsA